MAAKFELGPVTKLQKIRTGAFQQLGRGEGNIVSLLLVCLLWAASAQAQVRVESYDNNRIRKLGVPDFLSTGDTVISEWKFGEYFHTNFQTPSCLLN